MKILFVLALATVNALAIESLPTVIICGQSNAAQPGSFVAGLGSYATSNTNCFFTNSGTWSNATTLTSGVNFGVNQPLAWMLTNGSTQKWAIIQAAYGGAGLTNDFCSTCGTNTLVTNILTVATATPPTGYTNDIRAWVWIQGEQDAQTLGNAGTATYTTALTNLITRYRAIVGSTQAVWIVSRTGNFATQRTFSPVVRSAQTQAVALVVNASWLDVDECPRSTTWVHYDAAGFTTMAQQILRRMREAGAYP